MMTLRELKPGQSARIEEVGGEGFDTLAVHILRLADGRQDDGVAHLPVLFLLFPFFGNV